MATKRTQFEASAANAPANPPQLIAVKTNRRCLYIHNKTAQPLSIYIGDDANPDLTSVTTLDSFTLDPNQIWEAPIGACSEQIKGRFAAAAAATFAQVTEVF